MNDELVLRTLAQLREAGLQRHRVRRLSDSRSDVHLWIGDTLYFVRPLAQRSWTVRQALRDAEYIVRMVQFARTGNETAATA